jgi:acyl-CoA hydrolase
MKVRPDKSPVVLLEEIFPGDTNPYGTAFGGKILALMDRAAALAASRFARREFVTASLSDFEFIAPVRQGEIAEVSARLVYTSTRTCGLLVTVFAMGKTEWKRRRCGQGVIFMVAQGPDGALLPVPQLRPRTQAEKRRWEEAASIHRRMLKRRRGR